MNDAKGGSIKFHGILKGQEQSDELREIPRTEVQVPKQRILYRGYYVDTAEKKAKKIEKYIKRQLDEDKAGEQMTMENI